MGRRKQIVDNKKENIILDYYLSKDEILSIRDVAKRVSEETEYNVSPSTVLRILKKHDVVRTKSEAQKIALDAGKNQLPPMESIKSEKATMKKSEAMREIWSNKTDKERKEVSKKAKKNWAKRTDAELDDMYKKAAMGRLKAAKEGSKMEKAVVEHLESMGWVCSVHKKDVLQNLNLEIDIYVHDCMCVIEIDGPGHYYPIWGEDKLEKQQEADREKNALVINKGFNIIRVKYTSKTFVKVEALELAKMLDLRLKEIKKEMDAGLKNRRIPIRLEIGGELDY